MFNLVVLANILIIFLLGIFLLFYKIIIPTGGRLFQILRSRNLFLKKLKLVSKKYRTKFFQLNFFLLVKRLPKLFSIINKLFSLLNFRYLIVAK